MNDARYGQRNHTNFNKSITPIEKLLYGSDMEISEWNQLSNSLKKKVGLEYYYGKCKLPYNPMAVYYQESACGFEWKVVAGTLVKRNQV